jgi:hypothetical protein
MYYFIPTFPALSMVFALVIALSKRVNKKDRGHHSTVPFIQNFLGKLFRRGLLGSGIFIIFIKLFYTNETSLRVKFHIPSTKAV